MLIKQASACLVDVTLRSAQVRRISWVRGVVGRKFGSVNGLLVPFPKSDRPLLIKKRSFQFAWL